MTSAAPRVVTVPQFIATKSKGAKLAVLTAYDVTWASIFDEAGVDAILVGDSVAMVVQGHKTTLPVTLDEIIYHAKLVVRGTRRALVVVDMPFMSYQVSPQQAVRNAGRILKESGATAVKLEGGEARAETIRALTSAGIPVMAHEGLKPQSVHAVGGMGKIQRDEDVLVRDARAALSIPAYLHFFLIGFLLADIFIADWKETPAKHAYWDLIAVIGWPLMIVLLQSERLTQWLFPFTILLLYAAAFRGTMTRRIFSNRCIVTIGGMCYSIYLIHYEVISLVGRSTVRMGSGFSYWVYFLIQLALVGTSVVAICGLYFLLLEKPCMRRDWPQRLWSRWQAVSYPGRTAAPLNTAA